MDVFGFNKDQDLSDYTKPLLVFVCDFDRYYLKEHERTKIGVKFVCSSNIEIV